jgi:hypothetical protein
MCRIARQHFAAVKPYRSDGLTLTLAGIKDMNVLFSNFAFVVCVRGLCQVMEAAQADPDLIFKLQVTFPTLLPAALVLCFTAPRQTAQGSSVVGLMSTITPQSVLHCVHVMHPPIRAK